MRWVPIDVCKEGMRLAKKIYNEEGMILLGEGMTLSRLYIDRLRGMGISHIYVEDPRTEGIVAPDILSEQTRQEANKMIRSEFKQLMVASSMRKRTVPKLGKSFLSTLDRIIDDITGHEETMVLLGDLQTTDHYVFRHSLNVCVYSTLFGVHYGYSRDEIRCLSMGALLHDIGKTQINIDILNKPGRLTDEEFIHMKTHAELGFRLLKDVPNIPLRAAHCAFQHHERLDGSGYPRGIKGNEIHEYAKWIAIADSYDAMTTHRVYRRAMLPHEALELLYTGSNTLYEQHMLTLFRDRIAVYPLGLTVKLSTGEVGVVSRINVHNPQRPIVRMLEDAEGQPYKDLHEINLDEKLNIVIVGSTDEEYAEGTAEA